MQALVAFLTGEEGGTDDQVSASQISRLIVAGNSLAPMPSTFRGDVEYQGKKAVSTLDRHRYKVHFS